LKQFLELKENNVNLNERLKKSEENNTDHKKTVCIEETRNKAFNIVPNKNISHYQLFADPNGKIKAFFIPVATMKNTYTFDDSVNLCKSFNSTLIEIESKEKQNILESFIRQSLIILSEFEYFWINAERDSSGKWKWLESNKEFTFTNWLTNYPVTNPDYDYIVICVYSMMQCCEWGNVPKNITWRVICEYTFES